MINCIYGKAKENLRKIINARLVNNAKDYKQTKVCFTKDMY